MPGTASAVPFLFFGMFCRRAQGKSLPGNFARVYFWPCPSDCNLSDIFTERDHC
jgi:hypothetical protein